MYGSLRGFFILIPLLYLIIITWYYLLLNLSSYLLWNIKIKVGVTSKHFAIAFIIGILLSITVHYSFDGERSINDDNYKQEGARQSQLGRICMAIPLGA